MLYYSKSMNRKSTFKAFLRDSVAGENRECDKAKWAYESQPEYSMVERLLTLQSKGYDGIRSMSFLT
jgi:hypothetical protein